ncbi:MAG: hypothetical protein HOC74_08205 [Gemmatimonadetes bacterium]|nr:hypothetical protein [Gemmatimonadota bacterium]
MTRAHEAKKGKTFLIDLRGSRDIESFRTYAEIASRLKKYGEVQISVSGLADKAWWEIPEGGSPWHEYACYVPAPWMFFPHPKITPHIPADFVAKNRELLDARLKVIRELGLKAIFTAKFTNLLPESFFVEHPHLRGPRVDHPRRSTEEAFAWCVDLEETREMIEWMMAEIKSNVPEVETFVSGTNDAGSGLCWAAAQYSGPNGPRHCRNRTAGERVRDLVDAVHRGASEGGGPVVFRWSNVNFWQNEMDVILPLLPPNSYIDERDPSLMSLGTTINATYPFLGILDPLTLIHRMERYHRPETETIDLNFSAMYSRHVDKPESVDKLLDIFEDCVAEPTTNLSQRLEKLKKYAALWAGEENREKAFEAFYELHQAFALKSAVANRYNNFYCGVSMRHINRPLVLKPDLLTPEEETYWLPHVFNIRESEARMDYIDIHGSRMTGTALWNDGGLNSALSTAQRAGRTLENFQTAPAGEWLRKVGLALRMWTSEVRSIHNFYHAQLLRDECESILSDEERVPTKRANWDGDPGNLPWNEIMRDELDNAAELVAMLENGGIDLVAKAATARYEDTFLLGPDLIAQLKRKMKIMRAHWLDVQDYLAPPHK